MGSGVTPGPEQCVLVTEALRPEAELVHQARLILSEAIEEHDPVAIYLALSGGNDSRCTTHVSMPVLANDPRFRGAVLVDTGVAITEAHEAVWEYAQIVGVPLRIQRTPERYEEFVLEHGFPGPAQHGRMYQRLKERAIRLVTAREKEGQHWRARVMYVSGVRKYESRRRVKLTMPVQRDGAAVWCNPLFWWTTPERNAYQLANTIQRNPISEYLCGSSGDCLCGSMADPGGEKEMETLRIWFPSMYRRLRELERRAARAGVWSKWGHKPPAKPGSASDHPDLFAGFAGPMCAGCERRYDPENEAA